MTNSSTLLLYASGTHRLPDESKPGWAGDASPFCPPTHAVDVRSGWPISKDACMFVLNGGLNSKILFLKVAHRFPVASKAMAKPRLVPGSSPMKPTFEVKLA